MAEIKKYLDQTGLQELVTKIKAEDVKAKEAANAYADSLAKNYDPAGSAKTAEDNAKAYADSLAGNYDAAGSAAAVDGKLTEEVNRAKAEEARIVGLVEAAQGKADANETAIAAINNETTGILATAKGYTDTEVAKVQSEVDALEELVGTLPDGTEAKTVVEYVNKKTEGIATDAAIGELQSQLAAAQEAIDAVEADYLKAADKNELQGNIDAEAGAREAADNEIKASVKAISDDYLKSADKTELVEAIAAAKEEAVATVLGGAVDEDFDTLKEVAEWILSDTTGAAAMQTDVATLKGEMDAVEGKVATLEGEMDAVEAAVATKAEQSALAQEIADREAGDAALDTRVKALETQLGDGEGSVADQIADAKQEAITAATETAAADATSKANKALEDAKAYADAEDAKIESRVDALETASATHALASDLTTLAGRVTTVEGKVSTLETEMDAVEAKASANETAIGTINTELAKKAAQSDLDAAVARISANEGSISTLNESVATKAEQDDLDNAVERIAANEAAIAANTSAITGFQAIPTSDIEALFA